MSLVCDFADFGIFGVSQTPSLVSTPKIPKNYKSHTAITSIVVALATNLKSNFRHTECSEVSILMICESKCESLTLNESTHNQKFLLRFAFAKSRVPLNPLDSNLPSKVVWIRQNGYFGDPVASV